jgi:hypothetical protein
MSVCYTNQQVEKLQVADSMHCNVLTLLIRHPAAQVLLQVCVLVVVDAHKAVPGLRGKVRHKAGLAAARGTLQMYDKTAQ